MENLKRLAVRFGKLFRIFSTRARCYSVKQKNQVAPTVASQNDQIEEGFCTVRTAILEFKTLQSLGNEQSGHTHNRFLV